MMAGQQHAADLSERQVAEARLDTAVDGRPVHFLLRPGMRDRHFDTARRWTAGSVLNAGEIRGRVGAQVTKNDIEKGSFRGGVIRRLPLINLKPRPLGLPDTALVYAWGSIPLRGPFILDLDNPYALTAYNVPALRLYAPVLARMLAAQRCVAIVCMSAACREGPRVEFGARVADKAVVRYP